MHSMNTVRGEEANPSMRNQGVPGPHLLVVDMRAARVSSASCALASHTPLLGDPQQADLSAERLAMW